MQLKRAWNLLTHLTCLCLPHSFLQPCSQANVLITLCLKTPPVKLHYDLTFKSLNISFTKDRAKKAKAISLCTVSSPSFLDHRSFDFTGLEQKWKGNGTFSTSLLFWEFMKGLMPPEIKPESSLSRIPLEHSCDSPTLWPLRTRRKQCPYQMKFHGLIVLSKAQSSHL